MTSLSHLKRWLMLLLAAGATTLHGQVSETNSFTGINLAIPDGNPAGVTDARTITTSDIAHITSVQVQLNLASDFNGDLYVYLRHGSGLTVLLNRPGRTAANPYGYDDTGFNVTFSDSATNDVHTYRLITTPPKGLPLTGTWQPDARYTDPTVVTDTSLRTTFLSEFDGLSGRGGWVLFLAGLEYGGTNMLNSWTLQITGTPYIPPVITWTNPPAIGYGTALSAAQLNATANVPGSFAYSPPVGTVLGAGLAQPLSLTFIPADTNNYATATVAVPLDVLPQPLTVTANNASLVYGATNLPLTGSLVGVTNGDNLTVTYATANAASPAGSYPIVPVLQDPAGALRNYSVTTNLGTLTISPAPLAVVAQNQGRAYGAANPSLTWSVAGLVNGDSQDSALTGSPILSVLATPASSAGAYPITLNPGTLAATNYTLSFVNGVLTVSPAVLIGQANNVKRFYGQTNPVFAVSYSGFVDGDTAGILSGVLSGSCPAQANSPVGSYPITIGGQSAPNYNVQYLGGTLEVEPAPLVVQANNASRVAGQTNPVLSATLVGVADAQDAAAFESALVLTTSAQTNSPVGDYPIVPSGLSATNYFLFYSNGTLRVRAYGLVVNVDNQSRSYGAPNPLLTGTVVGLQNGDNITATYVTEASTNSPVGTYLIGVAFNDPGNLLTNYSVTTNSGTLTITPATLVVSAANQSRAYGAPNPTLTGTVTGLQNGDDITAIFSTTAQTNSPPGNYPINISFTDPDNLLVNYIVSTNPGVLTVNPAELIVQANNASRLYGETNPLLTVSYSGFVNGDNPSVLSGALSESCPAQTNSPVGSYPISVGGQSAPNYNVQFVAGSLTVEPAPLLVQANNAGRVYGQTNPVFTATLVGLVNDENTMALGGPLLFTTTAQTNSPVGSYPIVPSGLSSTNYSLTYSNGTLSVSGYSLVVSANNQTRAYGAPNPPLTGTIVGLQNGDNITAAYSTLAAGNSPVGTYVIGVTLNDPNHALTNYTVTTNTGALTITKAALVVSAYNQGRVYGTPNPPLTGTVSGLQNGDAITASFSTAAQTGSPAGNYAITISLSDPDNLLVNYSLSTYNGLLSVTPAALVGQANNASRLYGETNPLFSVGYSGFVNGDGPSVITGLLSGSSPARTNSPVGTYPILVGGQSALNYTIQYLPGSLTVGPAPLLVQANDTSRVVGETNPVFTASFVGLAEGDSVTNLGGALVFETTAQTNSPVGSYPIVPSGLSSTNYTLAYSNGTLRVCEYAMVVTLDNQSRVYGAPNPTLTGTVTGLQNGDNITYAYVTAASTNSPVGSYLIGVAFTDPDNLLANYSVTTNTGTLTITPAPLVVTAESQNLTYGAPNPPVTATMTGLQNGDNITATDLLPAGGNIRAGTYTIGVALSDPDSLLSNYTATTNTGTLIITKALLTVTANNQSRTYGAANPLLTGTVAVVQNGDNITASFSTTAQTNSPVGSYPITVNLSDPGGRLSNYIVTTGEGVLTITPALLVVRPDNQSRGLGAPNPPLTGTVTGLQNGEIVTVIYSTTAWTSAPVGNYPITVTLADPENILGNYNVALYTGVLSVEPAVLIVQANNASRLYGETNPPFTVSYRGFANGDNPSLLSGTLTVSCPAQTNSPVGTYPITAGGQSAPGSYAIQYLAGTLTVEPASLVVQANNASRAYGQTNPILSATFLGLVNDEDASALEGSLLITTTAQTNSPIGTYPIVPSGLSSTNYSLTYSNGALSVSAYALVVSANNQTRAYGAPNLPLTGTVAGLENGDNITAAYSTTAATNSPAGTYVIGVGLNDPDHLLGNYSVTTNTGALTITQATLVVSSANQSRAYGTPNPPLTGTVTGLQNGDPITASFSTAAVTNSPAGNYPINVSLADPENLLPNYLVTTNNGVLTITQVPTTGTLVSSANPAFLSSPVTFTSAIRFGSTAPGSSPPGSAVQFTLDGTPYGPPVVLAAGQASVTITNLSLGSHSLAAEYPGDTNFLGVTVALNPPQIVRTHPMATNYVIVRAPGQGTRISVADLVAASSDGEGGTLTFVSFSASSILGGAVRLAGGWLFYEPPAGVGATDAFTYLMHDQYGLAALGTVTILAANQAACTLTIAQSGDGTNRILVSGIPWKAYAIQYAESLETSNWLSLATGMAGAQGVFHYDDALPEGTPARFYRAVAQTAGIPGAAVAFVTSSANPALPGASVTFTANVLADDPGLGIPSGTVQFKTDAQAVGAPVALAQGLAAFTTSSLSPGLHAITFDYGGDSTFLPGTGALDPPQLINAPPIAGAAVIFRPPAGGTKVPVSDLLTNDVDPDGYPISLRSFSSTGAEGGAVSLVDGWLFYTPPADYAGPDSFGYTIQDPFGATASGTVTVEPLLTPATQSATFVSETNGTYSVTFTGIPWDTYTIQYAQDSSGTGGWQTLGATTANSWGVIQYFDTPPAGTPPRYYRAVAQPQGTIDSPFRVAVWTNFIANTNGRTMQLWSEYSLPADWPKVPPVMAWDTNCLLFGLDGFTAISQCNAFQGARGQIPATLLTPRHAYTRGHGMGANGLGTNFTGQSVWFCTASNTLVQMTVAANFIRLGDFGGQYYDHGILVFTEDAPPSITPMSVLSNAEFQVYYPNAPDLPFMFFGTTAAGFCSAQVPPFVYPLANPGDSGSPYMIPTPDHKLAMFSAATTSGPSPQMQADIDTLTALVGLSTNNYQLRWYDMRPWGP